MPNPFSALKNLSNTELSYNEKDIERLQKELLMLKELIFLNKGKTQSLEHIFNKIPKEDELSKYYNFLEFILNSLKSFNKSSNNFQSFPVANIKKDDKIFFDKVS